MSVPSSSIVDAITGNQTGVNRGAALYVARRAREHGSGVTTAQRQFFDALGAVPPVGGHTYRHPAKGALPVRRPGDLTSAELAWLDRLPRDPSAITYDQAERLAAMARSFDGTIEHPDARMLLDSIWLPVRALHDRAAAEVELRNAQQPLPQLPQAGTALADAIAAENPTLLPHEVVARAAAAIDTAHAARHRAHEERISQANARLAELDADTARRSALVHH